MITEKEQKVLDLIDENQDEIIEYLSKIISFKTVTPESGKGAGENKDNYRALAAIFSATLADMDFEVDSWEIDASQMGNFENSGVQHDRDMSGMPVVVGQMKSGGTGKSLILNGHYDVVPAGLAENWTYDPFKGTLKDGKLYGRGSCDMKGGVAAMIKAVKFIRQAGIKLNGDITVQVAPDEEATCMGTFSCCEKGYKADAAIIPEPTNMSVLIAMRGNSGGKITINGRAGHAEMTQPHWKEGGAVNAITKSIKILQAIEDLSEEWRTRPDKQHKYLDPDAIQTTVIHGGEWSITYPEKVELSFNANYIPATKNLEQEITDRIMKVAQTDDWLSENPPEIEFGGMYGAEISEDEPIAQLGIEVLKELGYDTGFSGMGSLTDAIHLINYAKVPTISIGPSDKPAHMADEFITVQELIDQTKAIALAIMRWTA
ncbi:MAG: ArgE/DapE family deacylase [Desulfobacterales bacterium]|nr:ArgE/DapE family deacylase [Desulfobacterales bacterium]